MLGALLGYTAGAYIADVLVRPAIVADAAREAARLRRKPILNVGAGTSTSSLRAALFGPTLWGDVNLDIAAPPGIPGPDRVTYGDVHRIPYPNKFFGAAIASHVLEHVDNPEAALRELHRVADAVFAITPAWWAPHTWLYSDHQWYRTDDGRWVRLWHHAPRGVRA